MLFDQKRAGLPFLGISLTAIFSTAERQYLNLENNTEFFSIPKKYYTYIQLTYSLFIITLLHYMGHVLRWMIG
jgi:hypothetical protein